MAETEELIYLHREKLRLLELYRKTGAAAAAAKGPPLTSATTAERDQCLSSSISPSSISPSSSTHTYTHTHTSGAAAVGGAGTMAEDYLVQMGVVTQECKDEEDFFEKTNKMDSVIITAVQLLTFQRVRDKLAPRGSPLHSSKTMSVLAVARERTTTRRKTSTKSATSSSSSSSAARISFYDMQGQLMGVYDPGHTTPVSTLAFEGGVSSDEALLLTGAQDGSLHLHNLTLWKDGNMVAGRQPLPLPSFVMPPVVTTEEGYGIQAYREIILDNGDTQTQTETDGSSSSSILSAMFYQHRRLGWTLVSGDAQGSIKFHLRNGTLVKVGGYMCGWLNVCIYMRVYICVCMFRCEENDFGV
jgi:hypothetical protein